MNEFIFIPAHVQLETEDLMSHPGQIKFIRYKGEWNPYPYRIPFLIVFSIALSVIAAALNLSVIILSMMK